MPVVIKMEKPEECLGCPMYWIDESWYCYCSLQDYKKNEKYYENCPLIPIQSRQTIIVTANKDKEE